jgi:hypothetical protein
MLSVIENGKQQTWKTIAPRTIHTIGLINKWILQWHFEHVGSLFHYYFLCKRTVTVWCTCIFTQQFCHGWTTSLPVKPPKRCSIPIARPFMTPGGCDRSAGCSYSSLLRDPYLLLGLWDWQLFLLHALLAKLKESI